MAARPNNRPRPRAPQPADAAQPATPIARGPLPPSLEANPRLSRWITFVDDVAVVHAGKVELGQGIVTAFADVAAYELGVAPDRVRVAAASTSHAPNEGYTAGSLSVQVSVAALRQACAEIRAVCRAAAALRLEVAESDTELADGSFVAGDRTVSYWDLATDELLDRDATGHARPQPAHTSDRPLARLDLPDKVTGAPRYIGDVRLPGMLHARVVRPNGRRARLVSLDRSRVASMPGVVDVVVQGDFVAVVATREETAVKVADLLAASCQWRQPDDRLPDDGDLPAFLAGAETEDEVVHGDPTAAPPPHGASRLSLRISAEPEWREHTAVFTRPYLAHASIGTSTAIASYDDGRLHVLTHSQGVYPLRAALAAALDLSQDAIVVSHVEHAGCYGHNGADDAAYDAAVLALALPGRPIRLVWSRQEELAWSPLAPAMRVRLSAWTDAGGTIRAWRNDLWSNGHTSRPGARGGHRFLSHAMRLPDHAEPPAADPPLALDGGGGGSTRNSVPGYVVGDTTVVAHRPVRMPLRTSAMRSLGAHVNVFAIESFFDELALAAGRDSVAFRLEHLSDPRGRRVIEAVAERADWSNQPTGDGIGRGIGYARYKNTSGYCAVIADVEAEHSVRVRHLTIAVDVGLAVHADGVVNQVEGGAIQAVSWTTRERVRFDASTVTSDTWEGYPIITFTQVPSVDVILLPSTEPSLGAGEISAGPTAAAIANAVADAVGVRVRDMPITADAIVTAIRAG